MLTMDGSAEIIALTSWASDLTREVGVESVALEIPPAEPPIINIQAQVQPTRIITDIISRRQWDNRLLNCYTDHDDDELIHLDISLDPAFGHALNNHHTHVPARKPAVASD